MKSYKMMFSTALLLALSNMACATTSPTIASAQDACTTQNQNMRPEWTAKAVGTELGEYQWRPDIKKSDATAEVAQSTFRPGLRETGIAAATCVEAGAQTY